MNSVRFLLNNVWRIIAPKVYKINVLFAGFLYKIIGKKIEDPFLIPIYILPTHEETTNFYGDCPFSIDGLWWKSENNC